MVSFSLTPTPLRTVTGANIPEDLFERILDFLDKEIDSAMSFNEGWKKKEKHELGRCSLTCRYWATRCQPRIFEHIRLRSKEHLDQLLSILESPLSCISGYIKHLYLNQNTSNSEPWIHLVPPRLVPKLSLSPTISLLFKGGWENSHTKRFGHLRSVHYMLPGAHLEFSSYISHLKLYKLQFRRFEDLAHLVGELRSLQRLECWRVKWSSPVPEIYVIPVCPPSLARVKMRSCTEGAAGVLFLMGKRRRRQRNEAIIPFRLDRNQQSLATPSVRSWARALSAGDKWSEYTIEKVNDVYHIGCKCHHSDIDFIFTPTTEPQKSEVHLETVTISYDSWWIINKATKDYLKRSDTLASRLPDLQKVVLGFRSQDDMLHFVNEVVNMQMENLRAAGKLRYAIFDKSETKRWMRVSPDSNQLEPTPFTELKDLWRVYK